MTDREKLISLLFRCFPKNVNAKYCDGKIKIRCSHGSIADFLLANGVRLEQSQATSDKTSDKTSEEQPEEIDFDYSAEDDNG